MRTLFNISFVDKNGLRTCLGPHQGRYMKETREEAEQHLRDVFQNSGEQRLVDVCGEQSRGTFRVDSFECYDHGDPMNIYVQEEVNCPPALVDYLPLLVPMPKRGSPEWLALEETARKMKEIINKKKG